VTLFTLAIFALGIWSLAFYATRSLRADTERLLGEQQFSTVSYIAAEVNQGLADRLKALEKIAAMSAEAMDTGPAAIQKLVNERPILQDLFNGGITAYAPDGTAIADFPLATGRIGVNYMDFATIANALKEGRATIDRPVIGRKLLVPVIRMAAPIRNAQGKIIGALAGVINLTKPSFLDRIPEKLVSTTDSYLLLISPAHQIIVSATDKSQIMAALSVPSTSPGLDRFMQGYEGSLVTVNLKGIEVLASAKRVPVAGWLVILALPTSEAFSPIFSMQHSLLLAALVLSILAGALTWWMLRHELTPMLIAVHALARQSASKHSPELLPVTQHDEIGQLIAGFNQLLTTLRERESALQQSEARLTSLLDETKIHLWVFDGTRYTFVNKQWFDFTGQKPAESMAIEAWTSVVHPDDLPKATEIWLKHWASRTEHDNFFRLRRHDGVYRDFFCHALPVLDENGVFQAFQGFNLDITERKRNEAELEVHRHHLERMVTERTAELEKMRDAAEAANRAKSTFLANMSHELRTPMNGVMGMVDMSLRRATDPQQIDWLNKSKSSAQRLLAVINNILDISKIEAERLTLEHVSFLFGEVLENMISLIGHKAEEKQIKLLVDLDPDVSRMAFLGDPLRLGQILLNLTGNALKFTDHGAITVRVRRPEDNPAAVGQVLLRIEVADTGIGIAPEDQKRLFTAFEQADGSMTRKYGGSGLGLAISKRLVQLMGGEIGVESTPGQGSTFWFTVRLGRAIESAVPAAGHTVPPAPTFSRDSAEARLRVAFAGTRILLAEDEPINQEVSRSLLDDAGLVVDLAEDGQQALELARQNTYALILMDMQMPHMNGVEATKAIRALPAYAQTPILAMTANAFDEDRQVCLDAGMNDHIAKPVDPDRLYETLLEWLKKRGH
jgi:PAS domain S-box-containing protein